MVKCLPTTCLPSAALQALAGRSASPSGEAGGVKLGRAPNNKGMVSEL